MTMKKFTRFILTLCLLCVIAFTVTACKEQQTLNVYVPDGAPALCVAELFKTKKIGNRQINITVTTGQDVQAKLISGQADIAVCPTNMAAALYNKGAEYKLVSANLFGLLYVVGNIHADDLNILAGKTVYSIGKGNTPEFVFKKILSANNIEYVDSDTAVEGKVAIRYFDAGSQIIPLLKSGMCDVAILGEPAATKSGAAQLFDLQDLWNKATALDGSYPQAGVVVSNKLADDKAFISDLMKALNANVKFITENSESVTKLLADNGSNDFASMTLSADVIARCNIRTIAAFDCKPQMEAYFTAICDVNPAFTLPDGGFYLKLQ